MNTIRCAVIGVGYLGRFHAQKYKMIEGVELVAVCDVNVDHCDAIAQELGVPSCYDYTELFGHVDAVTIAATTIYHYKIAKDCLAHGIHVLLEKPMTETLAQADELIALAKKNQLTLQIGHLERFNPARGALEAHLDNPLFIDSQRLAPFNPRGTDVNVVLDLMIHDIDLILSIVDSPISQIDAHGAPVLSKSVDIASVRLTFENGCVANVTASRVSFKTERKMRIFQSNAYLSVDYHQKKVAVFGRGNEELFPGIPGITQQESVFEQGDALLAQAKSFLHCIRHDQKPLVSGQEGRDALAVAAQIMRQIQTNLETREAFV